MQLIEFEAMLSEVQKSIASRRIQAAIQDAKRRDIKSGFNPLKPYQIEYAVQLAGKGETIPGVARRLHCAPRHLYRAFAALPNLPIAVS